MAARDSWEDEDVADSWDAEEEEEKVAEKVVKPVAAAPKKAAAVSVKFAAVEAEESEQSRKERMNRLIQESDLENAMALFGISKSEINVDEVLEITKKEGIKRIIFILYLNFILVKKPASNAAAVSENGGYFESAKPQNWGEFETFSSAIVKKFKTLETSKHYPNFLEALFRNLLMDLDVPEIRKLTNMASELVASKQRDKLAQVSGKKKAAPSLVGATKKSGRADMMDFGNDDDDYDGF